MAGLLGGVRRSGHGERSSSDGIDLEVDVDGEDLGLLIGPRGATLLAVQDLARVASQRRLGDHDARLRIDIAGYRERRREALGRFAPQRRRRGRRDRRGSALEPMPSADRKVVHDVAAARRCRRLAPRARIPTGAS